MNLPNCLTVFRLILVGVFFYLFQFANQYAAAFAVYVLAALTDWVDGYLARKLNQITTFGKLMDPVADKLLLIAALVCFSMQGFLPWWILIFVLVKESVMLIAGAILYKQHIVVYAKVFGKAATLCFNIAVGLSFIMVLLQQPVQAQMYPFVIALYCVAIALALAAFIQYGLSFWSERRKR